LEVIDVGTNGTLVGSAFMISSKSVYLSRGYPNLMRSYGGFREPRGSNVTPLKSTFNAEHFICRLSWSIWKGFGTITS